jgi:RNA polymerase sigma-70 factor (ECF subfamily)
VTDSDASLVARVVAEDDRAAFELLVRRYQSPLRGFLRRLVKNDRGRADDLAQDTFLKAYQSMDTYVGRAKFSTWLYRIAYNNFLNDLRKRAPQDEFDELQHSPALAHSTDDMEPAVERCLQQLTARQRAVFDLHYKKELSHQEVADALELPLGTVKSDLARGLEALRRQLGIGGPAHGQG